MKSLTYRLQYALFLLFINLGALISALGQITPSQDSYTNTATSTTNYGTAATLGVASSAASIQTTYIKFDLSSIPAGYTGANIAKATLKLYVNSVTTAGSFNVDYVNGTWTERGITTNLAPALGTTIASSVPLTTGNANNYIQIDVTAALGEWLSGSQPNDGIALVANSGLAATFDSKENTAQSHPAELDMVFTNGGTISGVDTASGSGLAGGGTSGTLNLALTKSCAAKQVLQWNGSAWVCATISTSTATITGIKAGTDLTGGGTTGAVTLNLDTTKVPLLNAANTFFGTQTVNGDLSASGTLAGSSVFVSNPSAAATTLYSLASATTGAGWGVEGITASGDPSAYGVFGFASAATGSGIGVYGNTQSASGVGIMGQVGSPSQEKLNYPDVSAGIWGDTGFPVPESVDNSLGSPADVAVLGTADNSFAGWFENNSPTVATLVARNDYVAGYPFFAEAQGGKAYCFVDFNGSLSCTGTKNAVVPIDGGRRKVAMSAIESPVNWFEDAGSAQLVNGTAIVQLDSDFIQTVNTGMEYKVFPVPNGDCKGLYVTNKTVSSFEVRELGGGASSVRFDYRIMALRKNYESVRFADHTNDPDPAKFFKGRNVGARAVSAKVATKPFIPQQKQGASMHPVAQTAVK